MNNDFSNADSLSLSSENDEVDGLHRTESASPNFRTELAAQLAELVPEAIADGQVDVEKLRELLDGDAVDTSERFGLFWPGKKQAQRVAQEPTTATLRPDKENSKDWDTTKNVFIEGDNLEVLKILQKHYHNKIKMIYIDPPYNTGKDFVYKDNFRDGIDTYLEWTQQVNEEGKKLSTNSDSEGRYHSNWLNMMYPRLKLARNLLTDDGVIFISIDYNEGYHLRSLLDEIFGSDKFVGEIYWESKTKSQNTSTSYDKLQPKAELILCYARKEHSHFNLETVGERSYSESDEKGPFRFYEVDQMAKDGIRGRSSMVFDIHGVSPREGNQWKQGRETIQAFEARGDLTLRNGKPTLKMRPTDERGDITKPFWGFISKEIGTAETAKRELKSMIGEHGFDTVKPVDLIQRLVFHATEPEDIILDFFAGSGTTGHSVEVQNIEDGGSRSFILVQLPELVKSDSSAYRAGYRSVADITRKRLVTVGQKNDFASSKDLSRSDLGFRCYNLSGSNFSKWQQSSDVDLTQLEQKMLDLRTGSSSDDVTADELLTEILLKQGYSLTETINTDEVAGLDVRLVLDVLGNTEVLGYLDESTKPTLDQLRAFVDEKPGRIIILEDAFQGDDELKTNLAQLCKSRDIELWTA